MSSLCDKSPCKRKKYLYTKKINQLSLGVLGRVQCVDLRNYFYLIIRKMEQSSYIFSVNILYKLLNHFYWYRKRI